MNIIDILLPYQKKFFLNEKKRKIFISSRQIGKSFTIASILCYKALQKTNGLSLCISTGQRASNEIIRKCAQFAEAIKIITDGEITYSTSFDSVKFSNGSRVLSLPSSTDGSNLRGFTSQCVCIDECAYISHLDVIMQSINPTLSRDKDAELILTTTPAGKNGYFYQLYQNALNDSSWYVQHTSIHDAIKDGLKIDLDALHSLCPDPDVFKQEYECMFSSEYGSMIDLNLLDFYDEDIEKYDSVYFSADIGRTHDRTSIVISKLKNGVLYVDDVIMLQKCEYQRQLDIFKELNEKYRFASGFIDAGGIGSAVAEFTNKSISTNIKPFHFTGTNKTPSYESVRDMIFQHKIRFNSRFKKTIEDDFRNVSRMVNETGQVKFVAGSNSEGHSDFVSSLVLNVQAYKSNPYMSSHPVSTYFNSRFGHWKSRL